MVDYRSMEEFAKTICDILKTDRWILIACSGEMGEGKSCFTTTLGKDVSRFTGVHYSFQDNITFLRKELELWVDGKGEKKLNQKPEFSYIVPDELISMFFKRNWYDVAQIDGIELLNKCRDRHLCVAGNIPSFWDLDSAVLSLPTFWVHIPTRGVAWVFERDNNPFTVDKWHRRENEKLFAKHKNPYKCKNFVCEIHFNDWNPAEKKEYYEVRNTKRLNSQGQRSNVEKYGLIKKQRDDLIGYVANKKLLKDEELAELVGLSVAHVKDVKNGEKYYKNKQGEEI